MSDKDIHFVWIGPELSLLEQLTIKLFQRQGMNTNLWSYGHIKNVPAGVTLRDASEILPKDTLFTSKDPGSSSSFSYWSDRFELKLLQRFGCWYSQLDVACLRMPEPSPYYFVTFPNTAVCVSVMRTPKNAPFIERCLTKLEESVNASTAKDFEWWASMKIIGDSIREYGLSRYIMNRTAQSGCWNYMKQGIGPDENIDFIHWWNSHCLSTKNNPEPGSFYHALLKQENLIP